MIKLLNNFDEYINNALNDWHVPGAAVAVVKNDKTLHMGCYGYRDVERNLPITKNTRFPIASMTKPFTSMGAALLVDDGTIEWNTPIREVLPTFRLIDEYATQHANLRDLLSHRTGLPRHDAAWYNLNKTPQKLVQDLRYFRPNASFRETWQYNNLMFEAVGLLCTNLTSSETWEEFIQTRILDLLGMKNTTPNIDRNVSFDDIALPYMLKYGSDEPVQIPAYASPQASPAGSMHSTLNDLIIWLKVHTHGGVSNGVQLVSSYNLKQMHTPHMVVPANPQQELMFNNNIFTYGLGWLIEPYQGVTLIHHGGYLDGFSLIAAFVPQEKLSIIVLTNIDGKRLPCALVYEAVDRVLGFENKDWAEKYLNYDNESVLAAMKSLDRSKDHCIKNTQPSLAIENYIGTYSKSGYADIEVEWKHGVLSIKYWGEWRKLEHCHYDVFEIDMTNSWQQARVIITFILDIHGMIDTLHIPIEPTVGNTAFKRQPPKISTHLQSLFEGEYNHQLESQKVYIISIQKSLYIKIAGQMKQALRYIKQDQGNHKFKLAGSKHSTVEFIKSNQGFNKLFIKQQGATYECIRIGTEALGDF